MTAKSRNVTTVLSDEDYEKLQELSRRMRKNISSMVRTIVVAFLEEHCANMFATNNLQDAIADHLRIGQCNDPNCPVKDQHVHQS